MPTQVLTSIRLTRHLAHPETLAKKTISSIKSLNSTQFKITDTFIFQVDEIARQTIWLDRVESLVEENGDAYGEVFSALENLNDEAYKELELMLIESRICTKIIGTKKCKTIAPFANAASCGTGWLLNSIRPFFRKSNAPHRPADHRIKNLRYFFYSQLMDLYENAGQKITPHGFFGGLVKTIAADPSLQPLGLYVSDIGREIGKVTEQQEREREQSEITIDEKKTSSSSFTRKYTRSS